MTFKFIEVSCIHHSCLHSIFVSLLVLFFLIFKNIVIFVTRKQNSSSLGPICYQLEQTRKGSYPPTEHLIQVIISLRGGVQDSYL